MIQDVENIIFRIPLTFDHKYNDVCLIFSTQYNVLRHNT